MRICEILCSTQYLSLNQVSWPNLITKQILKGKVPILRVRCTGYFFVTLICIFVITILWLASSSTAVCIVSLCIFMFRKSHCHHPSQTLGQNLEKPRILNENSGCLISICFVPHCVVFKNPAHCEARAIFVGKSQGKVLQFPK